jgi:hydrogenase expression/formation protein HypC
MCLAVPGKITKIEKNIAVVDYGVEKRKGALVSKGYKKGDYVIIQGGIVIQKVKEKEAKDALKLYIKAIRS